MVCYKDGEGLLGAGAGVVGAFGGLDGLGDFGRRTSEGGKISLGSSNRVIYR